MSSSTESPSTDSKPSTKKRDLLRSIETAVQQEWKDVNLYSTEAETAAAESKESTDSSKTEFCGKFLATFPYPYMNGRLHLGHTFTITKAEFAVRYEKLKGKNVLFPFGFHCTGMPIKACADKLTHELEKYGNPPVFPEKTEEKPKAPTETTKVDPTVFRTKRAKLAQKTMNYQWDILKSNDVPTDSIAEFTDTAKWLSYFPPLGMEDLKMMGAAIDWRRSFITTDVNPYYDSFVRWQFNTLRSLGCIEFGKRPSIYSPKDGQICADHDRSSGEGVLPQEYIIIKMKVVKPYPKAIEDICEKTNVYLVAGTLRPETMYGQTNCWILPEGKYGAFRADKDSVYICTERSAYNMSFQNVVVSPLETLIDDIRGSDLIGCPLSAPLAKYPVIYVLPMTTISPNKGTGIVTSVPSDSPDDYINFFTLKSKPEYCAKLGIKDEWVQPYDIVKIIDIPELGDECAKTVCEELKIRTPKDTALLKEAKDKTYTRGFHQGSMIVGEYSGMKVKDAKPLVREMLIKNEQATVYSEPDGEVISRSGDVCVVALADQWYLNYGDEAWKERTRTLFEAMETFHPSAREVLNHTLSWLQQWGCSRSFGLGSHLPWDPQYLIESLSDSTVYMAYYTVAHMLQSGLDGHSQGTLNIDAKDMTDDVWNYIFCRSKEYPVDCKIPKEKLDIMRNSFDYWYPFDLRVSGKDLLQNHLAFSLFNHSALWGKEKFPLAFRANGHLLIDDEKMSKSTGNFLTLCDAVNLYTADGMRFGLADAGDGVDDANFVKANADAGLLKLHTFLLWTLNVLGKEISEDGKVVNIASTDEKGQPVESLLDDSTELNFFDEIFQCQIDDLIEKTDLAYSRMLYREALVSGFNELQSARDTYRSFTEVLKLKMKRVLIERFISVQVLLLAPITPHLSDFVWRRVLGNKDFIWNERLPLTTIQSLVKSKADTETIEKVSRFQTVIRAQYQYIDKITTAFRATIVMYNDPKKKKKEPIKPAESGEIILALSFPTWMNALMEILTSFEKEHSGSYPQKGELVKLINSDSRFSSKQTQQKAMAKAMFLIDKAKNGHPEAIAGKFVFNEEELMRTHLSLLEGLLKIKLTLTVTKDIDENAKIVPGEPGLVLK